MIDEARASILRETRHRDAAIIIREMSDLCLMALYSKFHRLDYKDMKQNDKGGGGV